MPRVLMNFQLRDGWHVHFIEADCKTKIGQYISPSPPRSPSAPSCHAATLRTWLNSSPPCAPGPTEATTPTSLRSSTRSCATGKLRLQPATSSHGKATQEGFSVQTTTTLTSDWRARPPTQLRH